MTAMGVRKRFLVVVVGVPGSPAEAQRSEVGRFRSMGAAQQAGQDEWRRILFVHAPHVDRYRVVIEDDGVEVGEVPMPDLRVTPSGVPRASAYSSILIAFWSRVSRSTRLRRSSARCPASRSTR